jgi:hypothetical protein
MIMVLASGSGEGCGWFNLIARREAITTAPFALRAETHRKIRPNAAIPVKRG